MLNNLLGCDDNNWILIIILIFLLLCNDDCDCDRDRCDGGFGGIFGGSNIIWILILFFCLCDIF